MEGHRPPEEEGEQAACRIASNGGGGMSELAELLKQAGIVEGQTVLDIGLAQMSS